MLFDDNETIGWHNNGPTRNGREIRDMPENMCQVNKNLFVWRNFSVKCRLPEIE